MDLTDEPAQISDLDLVKHLRNELEFWLISVYVAYERVESMKVKIINIFCFKFWLKT